MSTDGGVTPGVPLEICRDCGKVRPIALRFKAIEQGALIEIKLCKGCMRNRASTSKRDKQNH